MIAHGPMKSRLRALDPRSKLLLQASVVAAAYAHTDPIPLAILTGGTVLILWLGAQAVRQTMYEFRAVIAFLALAPLIAAVTPRPPYLLASEAVEPALSSYRVLLLVLVSIAIVRTTPAREAEAAIRWLIPGRPGRAVAVGVGLVFRFLPVIRSEAGRTRQAILVRGGASRPVTERIHLLGVVTLVRMFRRADLLARALQVRCLSWNPTRPDLRLGRSDVPTIGISLVLLGWALVPMTT